MKHNRFRRFAPLALRAGALLAAAAVAMHGSALSAASREGSVEIRVTVKQVDFCDVPAELLPYVRGLYARGITSGCGAISECIYYCPNDPVRRDQMAKFLCKAAGKTELKRDTATFADVPATHPFYGWIERLADPASWGGNPPTSGCVCPSGYPTGARCYCPSDPVRRDQMAKFLCRATGRTWLDKTTPTFADVPKSHLFYGWIERLADAASWPGAVAVTSGCRAGPPRLYCPSSNVTRWQMAVLLVRAFGIPY
jgi:hypothetical protein